MERSAAPSTRRSATTRSARGPGARSGRRAARSSRAAARSSGSASTSRTSTSPTTSSTCATRSSRRATRRRRDAQRLRRRALRCSRRLISRRARQQRVDQLVDRLVVEQAAGLRRGARAPSGPRARRSTTRARAVREDAAQVGLRPHAAEASPCSSPITATGLFVAAPRCRAGATPSRSRSSGAPGTDELYSGVAIRTASAPAIASRSACTSGSRRPRRRRPRRSAAAPSGRRRARTRCRPGRAFAASSRSPRLCESRRRLPLMPRMRMR